MGDPLLPLLLGYNWGEIGAELGEWLFAGHQKSATTVLQRGHWVSPAGAPGWQDKRWTQWEPIQWVASGKALDTEKECNPMRRAVQKLEPLTYLAWYLIRGVGMVESSRKQSQCTELCIRAVRNILPNQKHDMNAWASLDANLFLPSVNYSRAPSRPSQHALDYTPRIEHANSW